MTDIIEAAARALRDSDRFGSPSWNEYNIMAEEVLAAVAPLIRAAALEEAAKEAEVFSRHEIREAMSIVAGRIAAAIRAIKERP